MSSWEKTKNLNADNAGSLGDFEEAIRVVAEKYRNRRKDAREYFIKSSKMDYEIISALLEDLSKTPREIKSEAEKNLDFPIRSLDLVVRKLRMWNIASSNHQSLWAERIKYMGNLFWDFVCSPQEKAEEKRELLRSAITDDANARYRNKYMAITVAIIAQGKRVPWIDSVRETARILAPSSFRFFIWELVDVIALSKGLSVKRSVREEIESMQSFLRESLDSSRSKHPRNSEDIAENPADENLSEDSSDLLEQLEQLEQDLEDFRAALECTQAQIEMLENRLEEVREEATRDATVAFFQEMNSEWAGNLLDQFVFSGKSLKKLRRSGFVFPPEVESIPASIRMFLKFLEERHIIPLAEVGTQLQVSLKDSEQYDYQGSDFADGEDTKLVEVIRPGWEYQGVVISKPSVREQMDV